MNHQQSANDAADRNSISTQNACRIVDESIEEYIFGILDPDSSTNIDQHLLDCQRCAKRVDSYRRTVPLIALSVSQITPPLRAKTSLMQRIAIIPPTTGPVNTFPADSLDTLRTPSLPASPTMPPIPAQPSNRSPWWRVYAAPLATLPLLLALGLVAAWGLDNYVQLHNSQDEIAMRDLQIARLSSQVSNENNQGVANLVVSPLSKRYSLVPDTAAGRDSAQGTLFADLQSDRAALQVTGLAAGTYTVLVQLQNGILVPKTEFVVGPQGSATTLLDLGVQVTDLRSVHIRPAAVTTETDVAAIDAQADVLMTTIGPDISDDADTGVQRP